jgi:drug/metabolite transporter (DMT)-like permease
MAKVIKGKQVKRGKIDDIFPLERINYYIIGVGLIIIVLGYIALSGDQVEGFMPLYVAPILLVLGYCVVIPIGIMYRKREKKEETVEMPTEARAPKN